MYFCCRYNSQKHCFLHIYINKSEIYISNSENTERILTQFDMSISMPIKNLLDHNYLPNLDYHNPSHILIQYISLFNFEEFTGVSMHYKVQYYKALEDIPFPTKENPNRFLNSKKIQLN